MYDKTDKQSIVDYANKLVGKNFLEILQEVSSDDYLLVQEDGIENLSSQNKGNYGHIIEKDYFGLTINNETRPDFEEAGIELKVSPIKRLKNGQIRAGERLVLSMIPFTSEIESEFEASTLFTKINLILFILYMRDQEKYPNPLQYPIKYVDLFSFYETLSPEDQEIIKQDYLKIQKKIKSGLAHELSEGDTLYLGACTKGASAVSSYRTQYYNDEELAKGRAFSFKQSFFSKIINDYIIDKKPQEEKVIKNTKELEESSFEDIVQKRLQNFLNHSESSLFERFRLSTSAKNKYSLLAFRMLGIESNSAEEFTKAGIVVKTIRIEQDFSIREHMSFTNVDLIELANENWIDSEIYNYFRETRFLFMIFHEENGERIFKGSQFWNMPISVIDNELKNDWLETQQAIIEGVQFKFSGNKVKNNIPTPLQTQVFHLRPKASKSAYSIFVNGTLYQRGDIEKDSVELPDGQRMTKQSFWLNKEYILDQLDERFKK